MEIVPSWLDTPQEVLVILSIVIPLVALLRWAWRFSQRLDSVLMEVRPNHGSSLRDAVNRIEEKQSEQTAELKAIEVKLENHIQWHLDRA